MTSDIKIQKFITQIDIKFSNKNKYKIIHTNDKLFHYIKIFDLQLYQFNKSFITYIFDYNLYLIGILKIIYKNKNYYIKTFNIINKFVKNSLLYKHYKNKTFINNKEIGKFINNPKKYINNIINSNKKYKFWSLSNLTEYYPYVEKICNPDTFCLINAIFLPKLNIIISYNNTRKYYLGYIKLKNQNIWIN